jgi:hypothetical protein
LTADLNRKPGTTTVEFHRMEIRCSANV